MPKEFRDDFVPTVENTVPPSMSLLPNAVLEESVGTCSRISPVRDAQVPGRGIKGEGYIYGRYFS